MTASRVPAGLSPEAAVDHAMANARLSGVDLGDRWRRHLLALATDPTLMDLLDMDGDPQLCCQCGTPTTLVEYCFHAPACSPVCSMLWWADHDIANAGATVVGEVGWQLRSWWGGPCVDCGGHTVETWERDDGRWKLEAVSCFGECPAVVSRKFKAGLLPGQGRYEAA
jgi:hypothetical protein